MPRPIRYSTKTRVALCATAVLVVAITTLAVLQMRDMRHELVAQSARHQAALVSRVAREIDKNLLLRIGAIEATARAFPITRDSGPEEIDRLLRRRQTIASLFNSLSFVSPQGRMVANPSTPAAVGAEVGHRDYFQRALAGPGAVVSQPYLGRPTAEPMVVIAAAVRDEQGVLGVLVGSIKLEQPNFLSDLREHSKDEPARLALFDLERTVLIEARTNRALASGPPTGDSALFDRMIANERGAEEAEDEHGTPGVHAYHRLRAAPWVLRASVPIGEVLAPLHQAAHKIAIQSVYLAIVLIPLIWFFCERFLGRIEGLRGTMRAMREDPRSEASAMVDGDDEIAALAREFNALIAERRARSRDQARLAAIVQASTDAIASWNTDGIIVDWNAAAERMFGYSSAEAIGADIRMLLPEDRREETAGLRAMVMRGEQVTGFETTRRAKDGRVIDVSLTKSPMHDSAARLIGISSIFRDIGSRKAIEREKREFVATVSHELRTPLTSIYGALSLIRMRGYEALDPRTRALVDMAHENSDRLGRIVNDFLDVEKLEAGRMRLEFAPVGVEEALSRAVELGRGFAAQFAVELAIAQPVPLAEVRADPDRLQQVFANLLSNAVKHSPRGATVVLAAIPLADAIRFEVRDLGGGIPHEFRARIFQKFAQADGPARTQASTGLGLALCKTLVERMNGRIDYESEPGRGTTFEVVLPLWRESSGAPWPAAPSRSST